MDYIFPNEVNVTWTVMIVLYPYITGLVAGAFIVSSLYHVFGREELKPVARFSLVSAFVFLLFAPLPLLIHLGQPQRALNIMITPHFTSAMSGFGFIYLAYLMLVAVEIWFVLRSEFVERAKGKGLVALFCKAVMLFDLDNSEARLKADHRIVKILAGIGIPMACLLHGYVGFLFGSLKANPWWSTSLMFVIFIFSAIVSGLAVLVFHYFVIAKFRSWKVDHECVQSLARYMWGFLIMAISLEMLEILSIVYKQTEEAQILVRLINERLMISYVVLQFGVFSLVPLLLLAVVSLIKLRPKVMYAFSWVAAVMILAQVLLMRWNVVIGGQLLSKSFHGYTSYVPGIWVKEGLVTAAVIFTAPFVVLWIFDKIVPLFPHAVLATAKAKKAKA